MPDDEDSLAIPPPQEVTCTGCGWVSFVVTARMARAWAVQARRAFLMRTPAQLGRAPTFDPVICEALVPVP